MCRKQNRGHRLASDSERSFTQKHKKMILKNNACFTAIANTGVGIKPCREKDVSTFGDAF